MPRVETRMSQSKGFFVLAERRVETINGCCFEQSWTTTNINVNIDTTTSERGNRGRDFYFHRYVLAVLRAQHNAINKNHLS